ncbi:MAG: AMP-binding protein, partial [Proteobacteria bacterium]|nr:AMP-binding protein [Pseudomonadota bacterium]
DFNHEDVWTLYHAIVFDFSVWELWGALLKGGKLIIPVLEEVKDLKLFYDLCVSHRVSVLNQTPSSFYALSEIMSGETESRIESLKYIIFGGEALQVELLKKWWKYSKERGLKTVLVNMYGITETTVHVTYKQLLEGEESYSNIGKRLRDLKTYVLDSHMHPVPVGVVGELYVGGAGLARGYLNLEEQTQARFVENPYASEEDKLRGYTRLYKTGDLVRWRAHGDLEYIGRNDFQVKLRGHRIELGEIEHVFASYEGIEQVCVLLSRREVGEETGYLVGYYVSPKEIESALLSKHVSERLPEYMVPSAYVWMSSFPFTENGKLDRAKLPKATFKGDERDYVAPRTELEKQISEIWSNILGIEKVGITDDFFRLGGDSILSIRIISKIRKLGIDANVNDLIKNKTIKNLLNTVIHSNESIEKNYTSYSLIAEQTKQSILTKVVKRPDEIADIYPASYLQMGMLIESMKTEDGTYHDIFSYAINADFNQEKFFKYWESLIEKHELLRSSFIEDPEEGFLLLIHKKIDLTKKYHLIEEKINLSDFIAAERKRGIEIHKPGLFRLYVKPEKTGFVLVFSFHHAITDGWSVASLIAEFINAYVYSEEIKNEIIPSYAKFIVEEKSALQSDKSKSFWKAYLKDYPSDLENLKLNTSKDLSTHQIVARLNLPEDCSHKILAFSNKLGVSPDNIFLSIYSLVLSRFFNKKDLIIGMVVNNRLEEEGGDRLFGLHLNTIPMRFNTSPRDYADLSNYINNLFSQKIKLNEFKQYPYGKIKSDLQTQEDIYQCSFNYVHFHNIENRFNEGTLGARESYEKNDIPLTLTVSRYHSNFTFQLRGRFDYIDEAVALRILKYMEYFSISLADKNPLNYLLDDEYQEVIFDWNNTNYPDINRSTFSEFIEQQAIEKPDAIAIQFEQEKLSYRELDKLTNQLARYIRKKYEGLSGASLEPNTLIGLYCDRSV